MKKIVEVIEQLELDNQILLEDIPNIDLYMDQVIQLFENTFQQSKRDEEEKILTKTMINNYAKGKLLFPIQNKKYSKEHLILISLIYQLKGALSINDIKKTLYQINDKVVQKDGSFDLSSFYESYLHIAANNVEKYKSNVVEHQTEVEEQIQKLQGEIGDELETILLIGALVNMSNLYRRTAEKLIDSLADVKEK